MTKKNIPRDSESRNPFLKCARCGRAMGPKVMASLHMPGLYCSDECLDEEAETRRKESRIGMMPVTFSPISRFP